MFVKPREATPETQRAPEEGVFVIGTGLGEKALSEAQRVALDPKYAETLKQSAEAEKAVPKEEDLAKTQEFEVVGQGEPQSESTIKPVRVKAKSAKKTALKTIVALFVVAILAAGALVLIAEPWVEPTVDAYDGPVEERLPAVTLSVGEIYPLELELYPNEKISTVELDADLLLYNDDLAVTALGEYFKTEIEINTREIRIVQKDYERDIIVFGTDLTEQYFTLRSKLRDSLGIEPLEEPRTELRDLRTIRQEFSIRGTPVLEETIPTEIEERDTYDVAISDFDREAGLEAIVRSDNESIAIVTPVNYSVSRCDFVISGVSRGWCTATAYIGFWKSVDAETYAAYSESQHAADAPELRENEIFVTTREVVYNISVKARRIQYYYYKGRWYAY